MKYRKKPVVIDAFRLGFGNITDLRKWVESFGQSFEDWFIYGDQGADGAYLKVHTLEGTSYNTKPGEWIIRGVNGEYYPCQSDIFEKTYESVDESHPEQGEQGEDPFIQKHLAIIMDKMLDGMIITHIEKMFGSLEMASVEHFIETGKVNGSLYLNIKELAKKFAAGWHNQAAKLSSPPPEGQDELWEDVAAIVNHSGVPLELLKSKYLLIKK